MEERRPVHDRQGVREQGRESDRRECAAALERELEVPELRRDFQRRPTFFAFYVGRGDRRFRSENERLDRELTAARNSHVFRLYPGAHVQTVRSAHARAWLGLALEHLAAPANP